MLVSYPDVSKRILIDRTSRVRDVDMLQFLLSRGADPNADADHFTAALEKAAWRGDVSIVKELLDAGAQLETRSALPDAAQQGHSDLISYLLDRGAGIDEIPDNDSIAEHHKVQMKNALCAAALYGQSAVVELLLRRGADSKVKDRNNRSALDLAMSRGMDNGHDFSEYAPSPDYDGCIVILQSIEVEGDGSA